MDDHRFDNLAKRVGTSRRSVLKRMVGLGGAAALARLGVSEAEAARRGYGGPSSVASNSGSVTLEFWAYRDEKCRPRLYATGFQPNTSYQIFYGYSDPYQLNPRWPDIDAGWAETDWNGNFEGFIARPFINNYGYRMNATFGGVLSQVYEITCSGSNG